MNYYNENDPYAAAWLRELIKAGHISNGKVDERSIRDVQPSDLEGFAQCHFFAGIGGWSYALRLTGWPDDEPVWTGSCPCQPFSISGKGKGDSDSRHLWPEFSRIIGGRKPSIAFGEQVASPLGREWLAGVRDDLEGLGYEVGAADLCSPGVGAPHIRQRLYWVAHSDECSNVKSKPQLNIASRENILQNGHGRMVLANGRGWDPRQSSASPARYRCAIESDGGSGGLGDAAYAESARLRKLKHQLYAPSNTWRNFAVTDCSDGKSRRFEPGSFPLAHGVSGRVGLLRGYGNAIVPQVAAQFIQATIEALINAPDATWEDWDGHYSDSEPPSRKQAATPTHRPTPDK